MMSSLVESPSSESSAITTSPVVNDASRKTSPRGVDEEGAPLPPLTAEERVRLTKECTGILAREFLVDVSNFAMGYMQFSYRMTLRLSDLERALGRYAAEEKRGVPTYWRDASSSSNDDDQEDWDNDSGSNENMEEDCDLPEGLDDTDCESESDDEGTLVMDESPCSTVAREETEGHKSFFQTFSPTATTGKEGRTSTEQVIALWDEVMHNHFRCYCRPSAKYEETFFCLLARALDAYVETALMRPRNLDGAFERVSSSN